MYYIDTIKSCETGLYADNLIFDITRRGTKLEEFEVRIVDLDTLQAKIVGSEDVAGLGYSNQLIYSCIAEDRWLICNNCSERAALLHDSVKFLKSFTPKTKDEKMLSWLNESEHGHRFLMSPHLYAKYLLGLVPFATEYAWFTMRSKGEFGVIAESQYHDPLYSLDNVIDMFFAYRDSFVLVDKYLYGKSLYPDEGGINAELQFVVFKLDRKFLLEVL